MAPLLPPAAHPAPARGQGEVSVWLRGTPDTSRCSRPIRIHTHTEAAGACGAGSQNTGKWWVRAGQAAKRPARPQAGPWPFPHAPASLPQGHHVRLCSSNQNDFCPPIYSTNPSLAGRCVRPSAGHWCAEGTPSSAPTDQKHPHVHPFKLSATKWATAEQEAADWGSCRPQGGCVLRPLSRPDCREHTSTDRASPAPYPAPVTAETPRPRRLTED